MKHKDTITLYVRIPKATASKLRKLAADRGWPHTLASVTTEAIEKGLQAP
jgi:hypothetical protein